MSEIYDADYFLRGKESGKSLYSDYRWMPDLTIPMVKRIIAHLGIQEADYVLDFGSARGYTVKALRELGYYGWGIDASAWAIDNCDPAVRNYVDLSDKVVAKYDWIIAKDVLEHVNGVQACIDNLCNRAQKGVFAVVPLSLFDGSPYIVSAYEEDVTHIHRLSLGTWAGMFMRPEWAVTGAYRMAGVKDNYASWERGNGFLTARRI